MTLDIRIPIGYFFTLIGAILIVFGLVSDRAIYERSLGINVNFWWGSVLLAFGGYMLAMAFRDLRIPIGLVFAVLGIALLVFWVFSGQEAYYISGMNLNVLWGQVLLAVGIYLVWTGFRGRRKQ